MSKFQLTPRKLLFGALVIIALVVVGLVFSVFTTMSKKENIRIQNNQAASDSSTVEILTPGGNKIVTTQTVSANQPAASQPAAASDSAASDPQNEAASETEQKAATTRQNQRRQRNQAAAETDDSGNATTTPSRSNRPATTAETPVEPINRQPARAPAPPTERPAQQPTAPAKKEVMDNLF